MAETDGLLKRLVSTFILDFASWLLDSPVRTAQAAPSDLPGSTIVADQVFRIILEDGREMLFHLEFQGRRSHEPMSWRMLDYMARLSYHHRLPMESVVLYIGRGAGATDTGVYQISGLDGTPVVAWRYRVMRLWQMSADDLLQSGKLAPLTLLGQTQMPTPMVTLTAAVTRMRQVADGEQRSHLLSALIALLPEEEMINMVQQLLEDEGLLEELNLPYLQKLRTEALTKGLTEGMTRGRAAGRQEGEAEMLLHLLRLRFGALPVVEVEARVTAADAETLLRWSERVLTTPSLEAVFAL
jgi:predicted transposase YdaD